MKHKYVIFWISVFFICALAVLVAPLLSPSKAASFLRPRASLPFDQTKWAAAKVGDGIRYPMANGLVRTGELGKLTEAEIITRLGNPSYYDQIEGLKVYVYELDTQGSFPVRQPWLITFPALNIDSWCLRVFVLDGKVTAVKIEET